MTRCQGLIAKRLRGALQGWLHTWGRQEKRLLRRVTAPSVPGGGAGLREGAGGPAL